jgi:phosphoribosylformylglycinamidine synthase
MKALVYVTLKPSVLDPQGKAIHHSVELLGNRNISDIRQGKYFEIALDPNHFRGRRPRFCRTIARMFWQIPIIEDYRVEIQS